MAQDDVSDKNSRHAVGPVRRVLDYSAYLRLFPDLAKRHSDPTVRSAPNEDPYDRNDESFLWVGFAFATGIFAYFQLPEEPNLWWVAALMVSGSLYGLRAHLRPSFTSLLFRRMSLLMMALWAGVFAATLRTALVEAPRLGEARWFTITGTVQDFEKSETGLRIVLAAERYETRSNAYIPGTSYGAGSLPMRVRLSRVQEEEIQAGDRVRTRARLFPPAGPVVPGGYDFSFWAYFDQIGASGFVVGAVEHLGQVEASQTQKLIWRIDQSRIDLAARLRLLLSTGSQQDEGPKAETELIVALLLGDRTGLPDEDVETLRVAGLAHTLAISGLHMGLFAGGAYTLFLAVLALFERISLRYPLHKVAAMAALVAATFYLLLSGASIATQRAYLMIALVFLGIVFGRRGLTYRSVVLAGLLLLLLSPEQLLHPGFQMSFAAVLCLIAFYTRYEGGGFQKGLRQWQASAGLWSSILTTVALWALGLMLTSLIAGWATGLIGAYHFARIAPLGLVGNILAMPLFVFLIMPLGILGLMMMPFGLALYPLLLMQTVLGWFLEIARFVVSLQGDIDGYLVPPSTGGVFLLLCGFFLCIKVTRHSDKRFWGPAMALLLGSALMLVGAGLWMNVVPPDVRIADKGSLIGARDQLGRFHLSRARSSFVSDIWLRGEGVDPSTYDDRKMDLSQRSCDAMGCVYEVFGAKGAAGPLLLAVPTKLQSFARDCIFADLVVSDLPAPQDCRARYIFDRDRRHELGALALWIEGAPGALSEGANGLEPDHEYNVRIEAALPKLRRPWHSSR
ncbi:MAG: ComEC/Rec2 family competence protein [Rhodobacteraceae bacterium]|nr:ComEC/Rec2 family competence protein [Paracoccaceae bacterium]